MRYFALFSTAASAASISLAPRAVGHATNLSGNWKYVGCYADNVADRALKGAFQSVEDQSANQCISYCTKLGYDLAGTGTYRS